MDSTKHKSSGASFDMFVDGNPTVGTYSLHIMASRSAQTADAWHYHAFITVHIVD